MLTCRKQSFSLLCFAILPLIASVAIFGQETKILSGFLVDNKCASFYAGARDKLPDHSKGCVLACGGEADYGLLLDDGYIPFDQAGGKQARQWLENTSKERDLRVTITFSVQGDKLTVEKIR